MPRTNPGLLALVLPAFCVALASAQSGPDAPATLRTTARLVVVDVVVTDRQGHTVTNLKLGDFTLRENKDQQAILSFAEHVPVTAGSPVETAPKLPAGIYANYTLAPAAGPVNILLLDTLNTPRQDQATVRQQLLDYLNHAKAGSRVAIFGLNTRLLLLQDLTTDPEVLKQAIRQQAGASSPLLANRVSGNDVQLQLSERLEDQGLATAAVISSVAAFEAEQQSVQLQLRARLTLDAMNVLARYLAAIPGRKNLIWFSGSFPISILPDTAHTAAALAASSTRLPTSGSARTGGSPFQGVANAQQEFRETIDLFSRSEVAVYPIQVHGLSSGAMFSAESGSNNGGAKYVRNTSAFSNDETASFVQTASGDHTMLDLANQTGGAAFVLGNGLADAVHRAVENGSSYYTLSYAPTSDRPGDYRNLDVSVAGKGYTLSYRRGYYADEPAAPRHDDAPKGTPSSLQIAMQYTAPPATQLPMRVQALPVAKSEEQTPAPGDQPSVDPKKAKPVYRRYEVDYAIDPAGIEFETQPDGGRRGTVEVVACVYALNGELANTKYQQVTVTLTAAQYASALNAGLNYRQEIGIPVAGRYMLRTGVHDVKGDRIGTVNLPLGAAVAAK